MNNLREAQEAMKLRWAAKRSHRGRPRKKRLGVPGTFPQRIAGIVLCQRGQTPTKAERIVKVRGLRNWLLTKDLNDKKPTDQLAAVARRWKNRVTAKVLLGRGKSAREIATLLNVDYLALTDWIEAGSPVDSLREFIGKIYSSQRLKQIKAQ